MDDKGFIFTMDAVLMLIPIFIIAATVSGISLNVPHESPYYSAQDALNTIYQSDVNGTIIKGIQSGNTTKAMIAADYVLGSYKTPYVLNYTINNGPETRLTPINSTINFNRTISIAKRQNGNVTLILYMER